MKKIFIIMALLLVICLMPAAAAVQGNQLFEVDVSPDVTLSAAPALVAEGGVSDVFSETLVLPAAVESDYYFDNSTGYICQADTGTVFGNSCKGWLPLRYHMRT